MSQHSPVPSGSGPGAGSDLADELYDQAGRALFLGDMARATSDYRRALAVRPDFPEALTNLANLLTLQGAHGEALDCFRRVLLLGFEHSVVFYNLANLLKSLESYDAAAACYRQSLILDPAFADTHNNLANTLRAAGQLQAAAPAYLNTLALQPDHAAAHSNLAGLLYLMHQAGAETEARYWAELWLARHGTHPVARHIGAAIAHQEQPDRASEDYIRQTFDHFAPEFDDRLNGLGYRGPTLVAEALAEIRPQPSGTQVVLDAGCGTGLVAACLRPYARHLTGVDLSPGMLEHARERGLYDALYEADLTEFLACPPQPLCDLIVAADVLCYFGDLGTIVPRLAQALVADGLLIFTLETIPADAASAFAIHPHGRYGHKESYVRQSLEAAGFTLVTLRREVLRHEGGQPVHGFLGVGRTTA